VRETEETVFPRLEYPPSLLSARAVLSSRGVSNKVPMTSERECVVAVHEQNRSTSRNLIVLSNIENWVQIHPRDACPIKK